MRSAHEIPQSRPFALAAHFSLCFECAQPPPFLALVHICLDSFLDFLHFGCSDCLGIWVPAGLSELGFHCFRPLSFQLSSLQSLLGDAFNLVTGGSATDSRTHTTRQRRQLAKLPTLEYIKNTQNYGTSTS